MSKYGGMKKAGDWAGRRVRLTREIQNGMGRVPKGTAGIIDCTEIRNGTIHFMADPCSCCGAQFKVFGLHYGDFELAGPLRLSDL